MVNTRSGNVRQKEDQSATTIAPSERAPQPQEDISENHEPKFRLPDIQKMIKDAVDQNRDKIHKIIKENIESILIGLTKRPCSYKTFLGCQPPEFSGSTDPAAILSWITEMEMTFDLCECGEMQKVKFAVSMLKGDASAWWNVTRVLLGEEVAYQLTWGEFIEKVKGRYCTEWDFFEMEREFLTLTKGNMTIDEYACLFVEKLQFMRHLAPSAKDCVDRFVMGLPFKYSMVRMAKTLDLAIQVSKDVEKYGGNEEGEDVGEKRKWGGALGSLKKSKGEVKSCYGCGKVGHLARECTNKVVTCFECGEKGHISTNCPNRERD